MDFPETRRTLFLAGPRRPAGDSTDRALRHSGPFRLAAVLSWPILLCLTTASIAESMSLSVAVASNFRSTIEVLMEQFHGETGFDVKLVFGSTGKLYAQIRNGAPFDVFLSADAERPELLEERGIAVADTRRTYALGRLVLWSPKPGYVDPNGDVLVEGTFRYLALASPGLAPYGRAAEEVLRTRDLLEALDGRIVRGENISQAYQFVASGNAELGFVACSQVKLRTGSRNGSCWVVPETLHAPIEQQLVLLRDSQAGRELLEFLAGPSAARAIAEAGYGPDADGCGCDID